MVTVNIFKKSKIIKLIENNKIFAVVRTNDAQKALDISKALIEGGIKIIEITMSYPEACEVIRELSQIEDVSIAAGSVITSQQGVQAIEAGADLLVSPITEVNLIKLCKWKGIPIATGAATPTEAYNAWKLDVGLIKIFPATSLGGPGYIRDVLTPMPFLQLMPTGGIDPDSCINYLKAGAIAVGIGNAFYANETEYKNISKKANIAVKKLEDYLADKS